MADGQTKLKDILADVLDSLSAEERRALENARVDETGEGMVQATFIPKKPQKPA